MGTLTGPPKQREYALVRVKDRKELASYTAEGACVVEDAGPQGPDQICARCAVTMRLMAVEALLHLWGGVELEEHLGLSQDDLDRAARAFLDALGLVVKPRQEQGHTARVVR